MTIECKSCGKKYEVYKGNCKYCSSCRDEINNKAHSCGGYKKATEIVCQKHEAERLATLRLNKIKVRAPETVGEVVRRTMISGRSYGHEVAVMEGREH